MIGVNWNKQELQKELDWVRSKTKTVPPYVTGWKQVFPTLRCDHKQELLQEVMNTPLTAT